jgi:hypothetical protein
VLSTDIDLASLAPNASMGTILRIGNLAFHRAGQ